MASLIFMSFFDDLARGAIDADTDTFWGLLTTSAYAENQDTHTRRSDVTNEVAAGGGYSAGGQVITCTVNKNTVANTITLTFGSQVWSTATITARKQVIYKRRGGLATADELVYVNDFGSDVTSTGANFTVASSVITLTVP